MSRSFVRLDEVVSFTVMLLMVIALIAGQSDAAGKETVSPAAILAPTIESITESVTILEDGLKIVDDEIFDSAFFDKEMGAAAVRIGIDLASDLGHFRGEDE